ncbi:hypothetical protein ACFL0V_04145 [Nanoarchaeota archaeon]
MKTKSPLGIGKKGQFFILTALLLIAYSTLMVKSSSVVPVPSTNFKSLYENFVFESNKAVNNAVWEGIDVDDEYERFLAQFRDYAKTRKLQLEVIGVVADGEYYYVMNQMNTPVTLLTYDYTIGAGEKEYFLRNTTELVIKVPDDVFHEKIYKFTFPELETDVKAVLRVKKGSDLEIFVKD